MDPLILTVRIEFMVIISDMTDIWDVVYCLPALTFCNVNWWIRHCVGSKGSYLMIMAYVADISLLQNSKLLQGFMVPFNINSIVFNA